MPATDPATQVRLPADDSIEDLYDHAPCGFVSTTADGAMVRVNRTFCTWPYLSRG